jgi:hypothetical protein
MIHEDNGAVCAVLNAACVPGQDLALLRLQVGLLQQALGRSQMAAERLVERQIVAMPTADEPEFRLKLIRDVMAVSTALAALGVHTSELLATIARITPAQPAPASA